MRNKTALMACLMVMAWSCGQSPETLPDSTGRTCEVWVADSGHVLKQMLERPYGGLPQEEPSYDVRTLPQGKPDKAHRYVRSTVVYESGTPLRVERNRYARPQLIIYTDGQQPDKVLRLLEAQETAWQTARLKAKHNPKAEKMVHDLLGARMLLPADLQSAKRGNNFVWLSNNSATSMRNICLMRIAATADREAAIDSVLRQNMPGETDDMYMQTVRGSLRWQRPTGKAQQGRQYAEGLWEMKGDAMGGPMALTVCNRGDSTLVAMVFAYAPGLRKRDLMVTLKASLHTIDF